MKQSGYQDDSHYYEMCVLLVHDSVKLCESDSHYYEMCVLLVHDSVKLCESAWFVIQ
jgi:hypothetical protein